MDKKYTVIYELKYPDGELDSYASLVTADNEQNAVNISKIRMVDAGIEFTKIVKVIESHG